MPTRYDSSTDSVARAGIAALDQIAYSPGWDDLTLPAISINPPGAVQGAVYDDVESWLVFQDNASQRADLVWQMPHRWLEGSAVHFHLHGRFSAAGAGNIRWAIRYRVISNDALVGAWTDTVVLLPSQSDTKHRYWTILPIDMTGRRISSIIQIQITRTGGHGDDTFVGDFHMYSADIHFQSDVATGSILEGTK